MDLKKVGQQYERTELKPESLKENPSDLIKEWMELALTAKIPYANAATLATIDSQGFPQARVILIKEIKSNSLVFFTNYNSDKARDIDSHKKVSLNIFWKELDRQIKIVGEAKKIPARESEEYFYSRPRESQISAIASNQSQVVTKEALYAKVKELELKYKDEKVDYPSFWGGFEVEFSAVEFWQGRPNRLHDRFIYKKNKDSKEETSWTIDRLAP